MKWMVVKRAWRVAALALLCLIALSGSACAPDIGGASHGKNIVVCTSDELSAYQNAVSQILPDYLIESAKNYPFLHLRSGKAIEALDAQAVSALETGMAGRWYPQYLSTMVIPLTAI